MSTAENEIKITTHKKEIILSDFIADRSRKSLKDLKGKVRFRDDYKLMRN